MEAHAAGQTGLDAGVPKKLLPLVAAAAMGAMGKQTGGGGGLGGLMAGLGGRRA